MEVVSSLTAASRAVQVGAEEISRGNQALSSRTEVATDDSRPLSMSRGGVRGVGTLLFRSVDRRSARL